MALGHCIEFIRAELKDLDDHLLKELLLKLDELLVVEVLLLATEDVILAAPLIHINLYATLRLFAFEDLSACLIDWDEKWML